MKFWENIGVILKKICWNFGIKLVKFWVKFWEKFDEILRNIWWDFGKKLVKFQGKFGEFMSTTWSKTLRKTWWNLENNLVKFKEKFGEITLSCCNFLSCYHSKVKEVFENFNVTEPLQLSVYTETFFVVRLNCNQNGYNQNLPKLNI